MTATRSAGRRADATGCGCAGPRRRRSAASLASLTLSPEQRRTRPAAHRHHGLPLPGRQDRRRRSRNTASGIRARSTTCRGAMRIFSSRAARLRRGPGQHQWHLRQRQAAGRTCAAAGRRRHCWRSAAPISSIPSASSGPQRSRRRRWSRPSPCWPEGAAGRSIDRASASARLFSAGTGRASPPRARRIRRRAHHLRGGRGILPQHLLRADAADSSRPMPSAADAPRRASAGDRSGRKRGRIGHLSWPAWRAALRDDRRARAGGCCSGRAVVGALRGGWRWHCC